MFGIKIPKSITKEVEKANKKYPGSVSECWSEGNRREWGGDYWIDLSGFNVSSNPGVHGIHEATAKEVIDCLRDLVPCDCNDCKPLWQDKKWKGK